MSAATYFDLPRGSRSWWAYLAELFGLAERPRPMLRRQTAPVTELRFGDVDVRERSDAPPAEPDYRSTVVPFDPRPAAEPLDESPPPVGKYDPLKSLKAQLRVLPYGEFIEAAKGMGTTPKKLWAWATDADDNA